MLAGGRPFPEIRHQGTGAVFRSGIPGLLYLTGFKLRRRFSETAREPCQVKDPQCRPDEAKRQGRRFEVYPKHPNRYGTNERQQKIVEPIFPRFVHPLTPPEMVVYREINKRKRHQRAKVDQRRRGHEGPHLRSSLFVPDGHRFDPVAARQHGMFPVSL